VEEPIAEVVSSFAVAGPNTLIAEYAGSAWRVPTFDDATVLSLTETVVASAATTTEGTWVGLDGALLLDDGTLRQVPWAEGLGEIERLVARDRRLWLKTAEALYLRSAEELFELRLDGEPIRGPWAPGQDGTWLTDGSLVVFMDLEGVVMQGSDVGAPVTHLTADREGRVVVAAGGYALVQTGQGWEPLETSGERVAGVYGHPRARGVWVQTDAGWLFAESRATWVGEIEPPISGPIEVDAWGRLLFLQDGAFYRVSAGRPVEVGGVWSGDAITAPTRFPLTPTSPETLDELTASARRGDEVIDVPIDAAELVLDPLGMVFGTWAVTLEASHEGQVYETTVDVQVAAAAGATWSEHVRPIYEAHCSACHDGASETVLDSPEGWMDRIENILLRVGTGQMPLGAEPLTDSEIALIQAWAAGGYAD
jgi:hypothetical protein